MTNGTAAGPPLAYARVAGLAYLLVIVVALVNVYLIDAALIVPGDPAATTGNLLARGLLFRVGIVAVLLMYASVVVLAHALYVVLRGTDANLALLAMLLRFGEAILGAATALASLAAIGLLSGEGVAASFGSDQVHALVGLFLGVRDAALDIVLIFVGLGGTLFCWLFFASRYVPRLLAAWGIFTYLSMLVLATLSLLFPALPDAVEIVLYGLGTLFELLFGAWLLIRGVNVPPGNRGAQAAPAM